MKNTIYLLITLTLLSCTNQNSKNKLEKTETTSESLVLSKAEKLASGFEFTEGPAADADGNVYFTDIPQSLILIWSINDKLDTFRINSGYANGLYFDKEGKLLICEGGNGKITSIDNKGVHKTIAGEFNKKRFNMPNDIWPDNKGGIYFTDPVYGEEETNIPQDGMHVYYINPDHSEVIRVCDDYEKPNGVIGTPDGKTLYVTDGREGGKTYKYDINPDGTLINKSLFVAKSSDGMSIDEAGNVYLTSGDKAVEIFSPAGKLIESIPLPEQPSNLCFGGKDRSVLFITARTSIYRVKMNIKGVN